MTVAENTVSLPIAFHRWFEDGAGWGCDEAILDALPDIVRATRELFTTADFQGTAELEISSGRLIVIKEPDRECPDLKAKSRHPSILKCCVVRQDLESHILTNGNPWQRTVEEALYRFSVPIQRQDGGRFRITVPGLRRPKRSVHELRRHGEQPAPGSRNSVTQAIIALRNDMFFLEGEVADLQNQVANLTAAMQNLNLSQTTPRQSILSRLFGWWRHRRPQGRSTVDPRYSGTGPDW